MPLKNTLRMRVSAFRPWHQNQEEGGQGTVMRQTDQAIPANHRLALHELPMEELPPRRPTGRPEHGSHAGAVR